LGAAFWVGSGPNLFFETDDFLLNIHMVGQLKLQYFGAGFWVGRSPNLFFNRYRWREYLSSGEKRAAPQVKISQ